MFPDIFPRKNVDVLAKNFFKHDKRNTTVPRKLKEMLETPRKSCNDVTTANYGIAYTCFYYNIKLLTEFGALWKIELSKK